MKVAYCTGFWCTNLGNGFFSLGVEHVLKKLLGEKNVTVVSDYQTYTTSYGKRLYPDKNQLEYLSALDVDYLVLAGPVISRYFVSLWGEILRKLKNRGVGYILLSAGIMKLNDQEKREVEDFFRECPPWILCSRDEATFQAFGSFAQNAYSGVCFAFFTPDFYSPSGLSEMSPYVVYNFDKSDEPLIWLAGGEEEKYQKQFDYQGKTYRLRYPGWMNRLTAQTDRFTDAIVYMRSVFPAKKHPDTLGEYTVVRTDHRFHPHFRRKIYSQSNSFVADLPYGYLNLYANAEFTLSDRVHACAATLAFGHSAMLFAKTSRNGLLDRVGAKGITEHPVTLDLDYLEAEKRKMCDWLEGMFRA